MRDDISIVLCGEAGQGLKTVESVLTGILKLDGYNVFATKEYMSRVRGGVNTTSLRVASAPVSAYVNRIDILIPLNPGRTKHLSARISDRTLVLDEKISFTALAEAIGNALYSNIVAVGVVCGLLSVSREISENYVRRHFAGKSEKIIADNITAVRKGYEAGERLKAAGQLKLALKKNESIKAQLFLNGAEAVGLGALAGGCNFICAYPMSPSTGVLDFLAQQARAFGVVAEQAEDEISAMNMSLGAWYAGARALVNTSGGGFALMVEGLSLAGMLETPVVVHLAQRPGPATGLPTRTEQADLNFALRAGHGEFPRIILAPGDIEEAFLLTQKAFNLADKFQVPVFVLTDQYLMDSYYNLPLPPLDGLTFEPRIVKTGAAYQRYELTDDGISPRGVPGFGDGLVAVDSDEHDADGHITEDLYLRTDMVRKRLKKLEAMGAEAIAPELIGPADYHILLVCWGTTRRIVREALEELGRKDLACLHFGQVYPLHSGTLNYLKKSQRVIAIENNAASQFADLIKLLTGFEIKERINKFNGLPFAVEEIVESLKGMLNG